MGRGRENKGKFFPRKVGKKKWGKGRGKQTPTTGGAKSWHKIVEIKDGGQALRQNRQKKKRPG